MADAPDSNEKYNSVAEDAPVPGTFPQVPGGAIPTPAQAPSGAPDAVLAMIERSARDPAVDLEKFERLMALKERAEAQAAKAAFNEAFAEMQGQLPVIDRRGRIVVYSKAERAREGGPSPDAQPVQKTPYATFDDILDACRPVLSRHGFGITFEHDTTGDGRLETTAVLIHRQGHEKRTKTPPLKHDTTGSKNDVQAVGSALTYGRRYALIAALGIVSHAPQDADDDGRAAGSPIIDAHQLAFVQTLVRDTSTDLAAFLKHIGAPDLASMNVAQFKTGVGLLETKKRRLNAEAKKAAAS